MSRKMRNKMKTKIQHSMTALIVMILLSSLVLMTALLFNESLKEMKQEVRREAQFLQTSISISKKNELATIASFIGNHRITLVQPDGTVIYDSFEDATTMENHRDRQEVQDAINQGEGEKVRFSSTLGSRTYYYAVRLSTGNVLRVASTTRTVWNTLASVSIYIIVIGIFLFALASLMARWQTRKLIEPLNKLDLEHPKENQVYEELEPLLAAIEEHNRAKEEAAQMRREFTANVTHELKTPLTSISGYAEIISNGMVKEEDVAPFAQRIFNEARRLVRLVEDLIKLSRLDEGGIQLEKEMVDIFEVAKDVRVRLAFPATKKHVVMEVTGEPVEVFGIRQILDEMIYNLCDNGIKYNVDGGLLKVWAGNSIEGPKVVVQDTGIGIPGEDQERVFERFFRVDKSHSKAIGGTGLGLSIVKHGALLHHAKITVDSAEGVGTKISILFPKEEKSATIASEEK